MKRNFLIGAAFVVAGVACIFPFIRALVLENIVVMLGVYFIYRGYLYLTSSLPCSGSCKGKKEVSGQLGIQDCASDCKKS